MRLIILNQFFYPDHSATSQLMTDLAESLVERGVAVTALAGRGRYTGGEKLSRRVVEASAVALARCGYGDNNAAAYRACRVIGGPATAPARDHARAGRIS